MVGGDPARHPARPTPAAPKTLFRRPLTRPAAPYPPTRRVFHACGLKATTLVTVMRL